MRRMHVDPLAAHRLSPFGRGAAAWEYERVRTLSVKNGKFQIAVGGCSFYVLPFLHLVKLEHQST
jgi:hypothetical protein